MTTILPLLCILALADAPRIDRAVVRVRDFAQLSPADACRLEGRRALFRVKLDSTDDEYDGFLLYDCVTPDMVERTVWLFAGQEVGDDMVVEAVLRVVRHKASGPSAGFTEYRLTRAEQR